MGTIAMNSEDPKDSQLMNYVVRMVVPMRREFGLSLDVSEFMRDSRYADEVLTKALQSQDPRLVDYARYVRQRLHGPRIAAQPPTTPSVSVSAAQVGSSSRSGGGASAPSSSAAREAASQDQSAADELKARVMKKYTGGLR